MYRHDWDITLQQIWSGSDLYSGRYDVIHSSWESPFTVFQLSKLSCFSRYSREILHTHVDQQYVLPRKIWSGSDSNSGFYSRLKIDSFTMGKSHLRNVFGYIFFTNDAIHLKTYKLIHVIKLCCRTKYKADRIRNDSLPGRQTFKWRILLSGVVPIVCNRNV